MARVASEVSFDPLPLQSGDPRKVYGFDYPGKDLLTTQEKPMTDNKDNIKHPSHYTQGSIETIDYIKDTLTSEEFTGHCIGSSLKYLSRWRHKGGIEDLEKASVYLGWAIDNELGTVK